MKLLTFVLALTSLTHCHAQTKWLLWSHHHFDTETVNGISLGVGRFITKYADVNGVKIDIPGLGVFVPMGIGEDPYNPSYIENDSITLSRYDNSKESFVTLSDSSVTNGLFLSLTGDVEYCVNGVSLHPIGGRVELSNGMMLSGIMSFVTISNGWSASLFILSSGTTNGLTTSLFHNSTIELNGLQISLFNTSFRTKGVQIGLWNKNEKRSLPFINWN